MSFVVFTVEGPPQGKGRPRFRRAGNFVQTYTDAKTKAYEETIKSWAKRAMGSRSPLEGPVAVDLYIRLPVPASASKKRSEACVRNEELPTKKPDVDNILKVYFDAMNGVVYVDDTQIVRVSAKKVYSLVPGVDICVVKL
jgi:Holliday junction resolvase RusA-like endonuclease